MTTIQNYKQEESELFFKLLDNMYTITLFNPAYAFAKNHCELISDFIPFILKHIQVGRLDEAIEMHDYMEKTFIKEFYPNNYIQVFSQTIETTNSFQLIADYNSLLKKLAQIEKQDHIFDLQFNHEIIYQLQLVSNEIEYIYSYGYDDESKETIYQKMDFAYKIVDKVNCALESILEINQILA